MERKIPYLVIFRQNFEESYWHIRTLESVKVKRIHVKPKFVTKISIISVQLHKSLKKNDFIWNQYSWIFQISKFCAKVKFLNLVGTKNASFVCFCKKYCHISNQCPQIFVTAKFRAKNTFLNLGSKTLFWVLWAAVLRNYCDI